MQPEQTNMKVVVRVRPNNRRELEQNQRCIIKVMDRTTLLFDPDDDQDEFFFQGTKQNFRDINKRTHKKLSMEFDRVFDVDATNQELFEEYTAPLVDSVLQGYNCSVFVYGATGAGKTFTMLGNESCPGLTYLTMCDLFNKIDEFSDTMKFNIAVSYLEVYNEQVMNLLTKSGPLKLLEHGAGVAVSGLVPKVINSADELLHLLKLGNENRTQHPTDANAESSRSHAIFQVHIRTTNRKTDVKRTVKLSMIDLAGSERAASTKGIGLRFREGANINKSLLALGNCINKLADGLKHIPYRDSNLTRILKDSLGGNCQTLMVANVSMSSLTFEDTYNTLKYASRAKNIRTTLRQNTLKTNMPKDFYIKKVNELLTEVNKLKASEQLLKTENTTLKTATTQSSAVRTSDEVELKKWYCKIDAVYSTLIKIQENLLGLQSKSKLERFNLKFKNYVELYRETLQLNQPLLQEDIGRFKEAKNHIEKQIKTYAEEQILWGKKLQDAYRHLEDLKKTAKSSKHLDILQVYLNNKDLEVKLSTEILNTQHMNNIAGDAIGELKNLQKSFLLSCEVLQKYFTNYGIADDMKDKLDELQRMVHNNIYPVENKAHENNCESVKILVNGKRAIISDKDDPNEAKKRKIKQANLDFDTEIGLNLQYETDDTYPNVPGGTEISRNANLDQTQVILPSTSSTSDWNKTFDATEECEKSSNLFVSTPERRNKLAYAEKKTYLDSILSDNIVKSPKNKDYVQKELLNAPNFHHRDIVKTVAMGLQKENKKHSPNRIRKSPRPILRRPAISSSLRDKKDVPLVRTNRAASFRMKK